MFLSSFKFQCKKSYFFTFSFWLCCWDCWWLKQQKQMERWLVSKNTVWHFQMNLSSCINNLCTCMNFNINSDTFVKEKITQSGYIEWGEGGESQSMVIGYPLLRDNKTKICCAIKMSRYVLAFLKMSTCFGILVFHYLRWLVLLIQKLSQTFGTIFAQYFSLGKGLLEITEEIWWFLL